MTEIEKAVKEFGWGCIREGLLNPHLRAALLAAITRREAEVREEGFREGVGAARSLALEMTRYVLASTARQTLGDDLAALIKEQP